MYRIDAWVTAIAAARLAAKRRSRPAGVQLGGYGWLLDLAKSDDPISQGFIHAPSLPHAASAAVLRSGWSAYGTASGETPLSVDLSSETVRGGHWVLDGVRNGQDLAESLGARLERYLHDAHLDDWIETIRIAALQARGIAGEPTAIVDGVLAARAFSRVAPTDQEAAFRDGGEVGDEPDRYRPARGRPARRGPAVPAARRRRPRRRRRPDDGAECPLAAPGQLRGGIGRVGRHRRRRRLGPADRRDVDSTRRPADQPSCRGDVGRHAEGRGRLAARCLPNRG